MHLRQDRGRGLLDCPGLRDRSRLFRRRVRGRRGHNHQLLLRRGRRLGWRAIRRRFLPRSEFNRAHQNPDEAQRSHRRPQRPAGFLRGRRRRCRCHRRLRRDSGDRPRHRRSHRRRSFHQALQRIAKCLGRLETPVRVPRYPKAESNRSAPEAAGSIVIGGVGVFSRCADMIENWLSPSNACLHPSPVRIERDAHGI